MILLKLLILFLIFNAISSYPIGKRDVEEPPTKKTRINADNQETQECYFSVFRTTKYETSPRLTASAVSEGCEGELISFMILMENVNDDITYLGALNEAILILARGAGEFDHDMTNPKHVAAIGELWICSKHRNELSINWLNCKDPRHVKLKSKKPACSMFDTQWINHVISREAVGKVLTFEQAKAVLYINGTLAHIGIPMCATHRKAVQSTVDRFKNLQETCPIAPLPNRAAKTKAMEALKQNPEEKDESMESEEMCGENPETCAKTTFQKLVKELGIQPRSTTRPWHLLDKKTQWRYISDYKKINEKVATLLVGHKNKKTLIDAAGGEKNKAFIKNIKSQAQEEFLLELEKLFYKLPSKTERRLLLSQVTHLPFPMVTNVITDLTRYEFDQATKMSARKQMGLAPKPTGGREIISREKIESFVSFFTSESFSTGIPFGIQKKKLSNGKIVFLPNSVRPYSDTELIKRYKKFMREQGKEVGMSNSSMRKILKACPAQKKVALQAVDQFKADGVQGFQWLNDVANKMLDKNIIEKVEYDDYKTRLIEAEFFLKTDFYQLLNDTHHSTDLCLSYALSDPKNYQYRASKCFEKADHLFKINRAHIYKEVIAEMNDTLTSIVADNIDLKDDITDMLITLEESKNAIIKWQNHIVRARFSDNIRHEIINNLKDGEALITIDYAQKWLPRKYMESQSEYYAKAGISMHIMHCICKKNGVLVQHTIVHFLGYADQDYVSVTAILVDGLKMLAANGVNAVTIRSDNAAYYHNQALLVSAPKIAEKAGLTIKRYSFSEAQAGKSTADVETSRLKHVLRSYLNSGNDLVTSNQLFVAIDLACRDLDIQSVTAVIADKVPVKGNKPKITLPDFQFLGDFEYILGPNHEYSMQVWKHHNIGPGKNVKISQFFNQLQVLELEGPHYSQRVEPFWREKTSIYRQTTIEAPTEPPSLNEYAIEEDEEALLYECQVEGCRKEFLRQENRDKHMLKGDHDFAPIKETIDEIAYKLFYDELSGIQTEHNLFVESTMSLDDFTTTIENVQDEGYALKTKPKVTRFTKEQDDFLQEQFILFMNSGQRRVNAYEVQQKMRAHRNPIFTAEQRLNPSQIASYFLRRQNKLQKALAANNAINAQRQQEIREEVNTEFFEDGEFARNYQADPAYFDETEEVLESVWSAAESTQNPDDFIFADDEDE